MSSPWNRVSPSLFEYMVAHPGELLSRDRLGRRRVGRACRFRRGRATCGIQPAPGACRRRGDSYIRTVHKKGIRCELSTAGGSGSGGAQGAGSSYQIPAQQPTIAAVTTIPLVQVDAGPARIATSPLRLRLVFLGIVAAIVLVAVVLTQHRCLVGDASPHQRIQRSAAKAPATHGGTAVY